MKLPCIRKFYRMNPINKTLKLLHEVENYYEVGEVKSTRGRCPTCFKFISLHSQFVDCKNGYGAWCSQENKHTCN